MKFKARTKSLIKITETVFELTLVHDNELFYFNAGQYVWIETKYGRSAFSIASSSSKPNELKFIYRSGVESTYMKYLSLLKIGDSVNVIGPRGFMRVPKPDSQSIYLAGGVGITPFLSIIRSLKDNNKTRDITLVSVNSTGEQGIYKDELLSISKSDNNFKFINIEGRITSDNLLNIKKKNPEADWYVVGSHGFVHASNEILHDIKVDSTKIFFEENFPSVADLDINTNKDGFFKKITDQSAIHIVITDANGIVKYANQAAVKMTGYPVAQMIGNTPRLWGGLMDKEVYEKFWETIKINKSVYVGELRNIRANGEEYDVLATVSPILEGEQLVGFIGMEQDITEEKKIKIELKKIRDLMIDRVLERDKKL